MQDKPDRGVEIGLVHDHNWRAAGKTLIVDEPDEVSREACERALAEAEALPDDDPDKAEPFAARREQLSTFDWPNLPRDERERRLRRFLDHPAS